MSAHITWNTARNAKCVIHSAFANVWHTALTSNEGKNSFQLRSHGMPCGRLAGKARNIKQVVKVSGFQLQHLACRSKTKMSTTGHDKDEGKQSFVQWPP